MASVGVGRLRGRVATHVVLSLIMSSSIAADDRFSLKPSVAVDEVRDDNLFLAASPRVADTIFRVSPGLDASYRSPLLQMDWRYSFDAERYVAHSELSTPWARQTTATTFTVAATDRLKFT